MSHDFKFEVVSISEVQDQTAPSHGTESAKPSILIVDDEPLIVDSLAAILASANLRVRKAYNGSAALQLALASPPDLLLTDVAMPGMNGVELAMAVAQVAPECRILLFSAHASTLDLTPAREAGYDFPLLSKPLHPREMLRRIFSTLNDQPAQMHAAPTWNATHATN